MIKCKGGCYLSRRADFRPCTRCRMLWRWKPSLSRGLEINSAEVSLSLCRLPGSLRQPPSRPSRLPAARLSLLFSPLLLRLPSLSPFSLQSCCSLASASTVQSRQRRRVFTSQMFKSYNHAAGPLPTSFLFLFSGSLLPQIAFHFTDGLLLPYQRKGLCTYSESCYLKDCRLQAVSWKFVPSSLATDSCCGFSTKRMMKFNRD